LLVWDDTADALASGITTKCIGDWQCPDHALCDDQLTLLVTTSTPVGVCKPGPRGTLSPVSLTPSGP
jgi:hypothetical protein